MLNDELPLHGGDIISAAKRYAIPVEQWIDLSTGMNPEPYVIPKIPAQVFRQLPYVEDAFLQAAAQYYGRNQFLAVSGSQAVIQQLPTLLNASHKLPILLPDLGYKEHEQYWQRADAVIQHYPSLNAESMVQAIDKQLQANASQHLLIINPNNPTGVMIERAQLLRWAAQLDDDATLIVDEAFIDLCPQHSLLTQDVLPDNIVVLRSFGKFFGLAGLRLGFVFANATRLKTLQHKIGLWQVNGPAQFIATQAFLDTAWQQQARLNIAYNAKATQTLFQPLMQQANAEPCQTNDLFFAYKMSFQQARSLADSLAKKGVLTRVVEIDEQHSLLRIGILPNKNNHPFSNAYAEVKQRLAAM